MESKRVNYGLIATAIITVAGWSVTFGVCQNKIEQNTKNIERLETRQVSTDNLLQSINGQLIELNTKMTLLLNGKINSE